MLPCFFIMVVAILKDYATLASIHTFFPYDCLCIPYFLYNLFICIVIVFNFSFKVIPLKYN